MRMRSRLGSGRFRKAAFMTLLAIATVFVMVLGLVLTVVLVCAATVFMAGLYVWARLSRWRRGNHPPQNGGDGFDDGVTIDGEYTVQDSAPDQHSEKH